MLALDALDLARAEIPVTVIDDELCSRVQVALDRRAEPCRPLVEIDEMTPGRFGVELQLPSDRHCLADDTRRADPSADGTSVLSTQGAVAPQPLHNDTHSLDLRVVEATRVRPK